MRNKFMESIKFVLRKIGLLEWIKKLLMPYRNYRFDKDGGSGAYWEKRYATGGNSGAGSYNRLAQFKANTINEFLDKHKDIHTCIEWGCGDGNQLLLINYLTYVGVDVSSTIIEKNKTKFSKDKTKKFYESSEFLKDNKDEQYDMALSLDVIFHLVEDEVFEKYMSDLFASSRKYICIYSSNFDGKVGEGAAHVRHRRFTNWVEKNKSEWKMIKFVKQKYPKTDDAENASFCDFYFYELLT